MPSDQNVPAIGHAGNVPAIGHAGNGIRSWTSIDWTSHAKKIWELDEEFQDGMLHLIFETVRHVPEGEMLERDVAAARRDLMFFVPSDNYLTNMLGEEIASGMGYLYTSLGECTLTERLAIPIYDFSDRIRNFIGYDGTAPESSSIDDLGQDSLDQENGDSESDFPDVSSLYIKYKYPVARALPKARFMYMRAQQYLKALEDGYIMVVDGIFDQRRLASEGYNAVSLMGSALTYWHKLYLSKIPNIIVVPDNDMAGKKLVWRCKKAFPHVSALYQNHTWDIDDFLKDTARIQLFQQEFERMRASGFLLDGYIQKSNKEALHGIKTKERPVHTCKLKSREEQL